MRFPSLLVLAISLVFAGCGGGGGGGSSAAMTGPDTTWVTQMGGPGFAPEGPGSVVALPDGGALVTGNFLERGVFGLGEPNERIQDLPPTSEAAAYITRLDASGRVVWTRILNGPDHDLLFGIEAFPDGSFAVVGTVRGTLVLGLGEPAETALGSDPGAVFVARYEADGSLRWARQLDGASAQARPVVAVDGVRDLVYVGVTIDRPLVLGADGPAPAVHAPLREEDWVVAAYGAYGHLAWSRQGFSTGSTILTGLAASAADVLAIGVFGSSLGLDPANPDEPRLLAGNAIYHGFGVRLDGGAGTTRWLTRLGAGSFVIPGDIHASATGHIAVVGLFADAATFGLAEREETRLVGQGGLNGFVLQLDAFGELEWVRRFEGIRFSALQSVHVDAQGVTTLALDVTEEMVFAPGELLQQRVFGDGLDFALVRYSAAGKLQTVVQHGGPGDQEPTDLDMYPDGSLLVIGRFETTAEIGGGTPRDVLLTEPGPDFVARLGPDGMR